MSKLLLSIDSVSTSKKQMKLLSVKMVSSKPKELKRLPRLKMHLSILNNKILLFNKIVKNKKLQFNVQAKKLRLSKLTV